MKIYRTAQAGSLESQDILITIKKGKENSGIVIELDSPSIVQYGKRIRNEIEEIVNKFELSDIIIQAIDKGALGFTVKARTETAIERACRDKEDILND
ncbi:MAG: citrate lyase acyl carrier protein [Candidatus Heimdallarchaeota archaeon]|nr:citrate lyase acyl carrier protein [Candidatus Heimdallarchaeota archaeon]